MMNFQNLESSKAIKRCLNNKNSLIGGGNVNTIYELSKEFQYDLLRRLVYIGYTSEY